MRIRAENSVEAVSRLLLKLYETPLVPSEWPRFLEQFALMLGLPAVTIQDYDSASKSYHFDIFFGMDPKALADYEQHFGRLDPYWPEFLKAPKSEVIRGDQLCPRDRLLETEFYHDFLAHHDEPLAIYCVAGRGIQTSRWHVISAYQRFRDECPPDRTANLFGIVAPHIRSTLEMQGHLGSLMAERSHIGLALDALGSAVILLDETGRSVFVSRKAATLVGYEQSLDLQRGHLIARRSSEAAALDLLIAKTLNTALRGSPYVSRPVLVSRRAAGPLRISATAIPRNVAPKLAAGTSQDAAVIIFIRDTDENARTLSGLLRAVYNLTPAEIRLTLLLHVGRSLWECAESNHVSIETVRAQLKAIYQKTSVRRQVQLLQLVNELAQSQ